MVDGSRFATSDIMSCESHVELSAQGEDISHLAERTGDIHDKVRWDEVQHHLHQRQRQRVQIGQEQVRSEEAF